VQYPENAFAFNDSLKTMKSKDPAFEGNFGYSEDFSAIDIVELNLRYNCTLNAPLVLDYVNEYFDIIISRRRMDHHAIAKLEVQSNNDHTKIVDLEAQIVKLEDQSKIDQQKMKQLEDQSKIYEDKISKLTDQIKVDEERFVRIEHLIEEMTKQNQTHTECRNGAELLSTSPGEDMVICKDMQGDTCEQDFETLCPVGWNLCTPLQFNHRNFGWDFTWSLKEHPLGVIYCRHNGEAGHFTILEHMMSKDEPVNYRHGSSRPGCESSYGCNEKSCSALCCLPRRGCGNGVVDHVEEECDDGNQVETDECLASCTWRTPTDHGIHGSTC